MIDLSYLTPEALRDLARNESAPPETRNAALKRLQEFGFMFTHAAPLSEQ